MYLFSGISGIYFAPDARLSDFFIRSARGSSGEKKMILAKVACGSIGELDAISHWWPAEKKQAALRQTENRNPPAGHTSATGRNHTEVVVYGNYYAYPEYVITYKLAWQLPDPYQQGKGYLLRYEDVDPRQADRQMLLRQPTRGAEAEERAAGAQAERDCMVEGTMLIAGATGSSATNINGAYIPTGQVHNGRELLQKEGGQNKWLRYTTGNRWVVSGTKDANNLNGWVHSEAGVADPALASTWKVLDGGAWEEQGSAAVAHALQRVLIAGATGSSATNINGAYIPTGQVHNGRELLQKEGGQNKWLRYTTGNRWVVSGTKDANNLSGWMHSEAGVADPALANTWKVLDGGAWEEQGSVAVHI